MKEASEENSTNVFMKSLKMFLGANIKEGDAEVFSCSESRSRILMY